MLIKKLLVEESDERYKYLLKHVVIHFIESLNQSIYVELPQIPNIIIVYRRPKERAKCPDSFYLANRQLRHIPLLEGEEGIKDLNLRANCIARIENLVSLPLLEKLELSQNFISEI